MTIRTDVSQRSIVALLLIVIYVNNITKGSALVIVLFANFTSFLDYFK